MRSLFLRITTAAFLLISLQGLMMVETVEAGQSAGISLEASAADGDPSSSSTSDCHSGSHQCHFGHCPAIVIESTSGPMSSIESEPFVFSVLPISSSLRDLFRPP